MTSIVPPTYHITRSDNLIYLNSRCLFVYLFVSLHYPIFLRLPTLVTLNTTLLIYASPEVASLLWINVELRTYTETKTKTKKNVIDTNNKCSVITTAVDI